MLIEIFNNKIYESTYGNLENGVQSRHVPYTYITEKNDKIINQYNIVKNFIIHTLDQTPGYNLKKGGYYAIYINRTCNIYPGHQSSDSLLEDTEFKFSFDKIGITNFETIVGKVILHGPDNNIRLYTRSVVSTFSRKDRYVDNHNIQNKDSDTSINDNPTIELSSDSFSESTGTIEVSCPEMKIGTVKESTFNINEERQAAQDAFLKQMNSKFCKK